MKKSINILGMVITTAMLLFACSKVKELPYYNDGKAVSLSASKATLTPAPADSLKEVISFSWTNPLYASDSSTYKYVLEIDSAGKNFSNRARKEISGALNTSLTGKELNTILLNFGFPPGSAYNLDVRILSSYSNNNEQYKSNTVNVMVTPYGDSSVLVSSVTSVKPALSTSTQKAVDFSWSASFNGYAGSNVIYTIQYDSAGKQFANPTEIQVGNGTYAKALTQGELNETALTSGIAGEQTGTVEYRIKAATSFGAAVYSNVVKISIETYIPILRFYLPGNYQQLLGYGANDWTPETAPEFVRDLRPSVFNDLYYLYIYLPAGAQFKVTQGRSWDVSYGGSAGSLASSGGNISIANAGFYRISISRKTMKYDISEGRMGFVGGATGAGWNPPNVFPNYAMGLAAANVFVGITDLTADTWKMIDNNQWNDGSNSVSETRSYGSKDASGSLIEINSDNFPAITTAGRYRAIWDGRDVNAVKYLLSPATEMRLVGDGINETGVNDWDPASSPKMTYAGKGKWTLTVKLKAGKDIKFLAGNAWGAFDYEDNSGQADATGKARSIKWDGDKNFKTPATEGTYTITLDEYTQTVIIE